MVMASFYPHVMFDAFCSIKTDRLVHTDNGTQLGAVLTATFGVTGYSLPPDQIGYWAVKMVTGVTEAT